MVYSVQQIKFEIFRYIKELGGSFGQWYVGIAGNPKETMQLEHGIDLERDVWLYKQAVSFSACKAVQRYFVEKLGTDGDLINRGNDDMDCVYLFRKGGRTRPSG